MELEVIESTGPIDGMAVYTLPNGKKVSIGRNDLDFFYRLQQLPAPTKIVMMQLSDSDLEYYLLNKRLSLNRQVLQLFTKKWYWRETGDVACISKEVIPGIYLDKRQIRRKCKSAKNPFSISELEIIIDFFTGDKSEVYQKL